MGSELSVRGNSFGLSSRIERAVARRDDRIVAEVHGAGKKVEGAMALAAHIMECAAQLDSHRRRLVTQAGVGDELAAVELNAALMRFEANAFAQAEREQRGLFNEWF